MELFFHHVGLSGAAEEFPRTIYRQLDLSIVEENVANDILCETNLLSSLRREFPNGKC
jgi:hypothetical protein